MSFAHRIPDGAGGLLKLETLSKICLGGLPAFNNVSLMLEESRTFKYQIEFVNRHFPPKRKKIYMGLLKGSRADAYKYACITIEELGLFPLQGYFMADDYEEQECRALVINSLAINFWDEWDPECEYEAVFAATLISHQCMAVESFRDSDYARERFGRFNWHGLDSSSLETEVYRALPEKIRRAVKDKKRAENLVFLFRYANFSTGCYFLDNDYESMYQNSYGWEDAHNFYEEWNKHKSKYFNMVEFVKKAEKNDVELQKIIDDYAEALGYAKVLSTANTRAPGGN